MKKKKILKALEALVLLAETQHCTHDETHREGVLWEACNWCDARWADDEGGKPDDAGEYPAEIVRAREIMEKTKRPIVENTDKAKEQKQLSGQGNSGGAAGFTYLLDELFFDIHNDKYRLFLIAHKGIDTGRNVQIFYNGELGYVLYKNGSMMTTDDFASDQALRSTLMRWNIEPRG